MTPTRKTATVVGLLFLTQTVAFIIAEQLITGVLKRPNYLTSASADVNTLTLGGLLAVISGVAVVGIAVLLFPLLKPTSEPLALDTSVNESSSLCCSLSSFWWFHCSWLRSVTGCTPAP
jgi:hypothetical protein